MAEQKLCVFNATRQSFLSFGVSTAETHFARLRGLAGRLRLRNDDGLWMVPCQGVHTIGVLFPIDLVYLDESLRVVHVVENLAPFRFSPLRMNSSSVLELPTRTVFWSSTRVGDQFLICSPEDLADYWGSAQAQSVAEGQPMWEGLFGGSGGQPRKPSAGWAARIAGWIKGSGNGHGMPDTVPLCAYYWEGGIPRAHEVVKISDSGAYLKTLQPWPVATIVDLSVQPKQEAGDASEQRKDVLRLSCQVVRSDPDGIGVRFLFTQADERRRVRKFLSAVKAGKD